MKYILLYLCFLLSVNSFAITPLTNAEEAIVDSVFREYYKSRTAEEYEIMLKDLDYLLSATKESFKLKEYSMTSLFAKKTYSLPCDEFDKVQVIQFLNFAALAQIDTTIIEVIDKYRSGNSNAPEAIKNRDLRNVIYYLDKRILPSYNAAPLIWAVAKLEASNENNSSIDFFVKNVKEWLPVQAEMWRFTLDSTISNLKDIAVLLYKESHETHNIDGLSFSSAEEELINYGLIQNPKDVKLLTYASLLSVKSEEKNMKFNADRENILQILSKSEVNNNDSIIHFRINLLQKAFEIDSTIPKAYYVLGRLYCFIEKWDDFLSTSEKALQFLKPNNDLWQQIQDTRLDVYAKLSQPENVIATYEQILKGRPSYNDEQMELFISSAYLDLKQPDKAYAYLFDSVQCTDEKYLNGSTVPWFFGTDFTWTALLAQEYESAKKVEEYYKQNLFDTPSNHKQNKKLLQADSVSYAMAMANIGHCYLNENNKRKAMKYYIKSRDIILRNHSDGTAAGLKEFKHWMLEDFDVMRSYGLPVPNTKYIIKKLKLASEN